jgi:hypothetical protein
VEVVPVVVVSFVGVVSVVDVVFVVDVVSVVDVVPVVVDSSGDVVPKKPRKERFPQQKR